MKVSVIIPTLNEGSRIRSLVEFLLQYSGPDLCEILVIDAPTSSDICADKLQDLPRVKYFVASQTSRAIQLNEGANIAQGNILYFIHADVLPPKNFDCHITTAISTGTDYGYFSYQFDSNRPLLRLNAYTTRYEGIFTGGGDQTFFIRKTLFESMNGFRNDLVIMEDFDLYWRLRKTKANFEILSPRVTVSARKYNHNSYLKVNLVNLCTFTLFRMGFCQYRLKKFYARALKK